MAVRAWDPTGRTTGAGWQVVAGRVTVQTVTGDPPTTLLTVTVPVGAGAPGPAEYGVTAVVMVTDASSSRATEDGDTAVMAVVVESLVTVRASGETAVEVVKLPSSGV